MKKIIRIFLAMAVCFGFLGNVLYQPAYADEDKDKGDGKPTMNVLPCGDEEKGEDNIMCVLRLVVNIMTVGIGILGTIGVIIAGIQYVSSQGDPGKMTKAKNRIIQIVIGLVVYAVMYAALYFLVPGFSLDDYGL